MTTTVIHSVGTASRDYSLPQAWYDAIPSSCVAADTQQIGEFYNDSTFTSNNLNWGGKTTDATRNIIARAAAGQGFNNHPSRLTRKLTYNAANGVTLASSTGGGYTFNFTFNQTDFEILGFQFFSDGGSGARTVVNMTGVTNQKITSCIVAASGSFVSALSTNGTVISSNVLAIGTNGCAQLFVCRSASAPFRFCSGVFLSSTAGGTDWSGSYNSVDIKNCVTFTASSGTAGSFYGFATGDASGNDYNATNVTSGPGGTHSLKSRVAATEFASLVNDSTADVRLIASSTIKAAGLYDANYPTDILGQTRPTSNPSIGCFQYAVAAPAAVYQFAGIPLGVLNQ